MSARPQLCSFCWMVCYPEITEANDVRVSKCECEKGCGHGLRNIVPGGVQS